MPRKCPKTKSAKVKFRKTQRPRLKVTFKGSWPGKSTPTKTYTRATRGKSTSKSTRRP